MQYLISTSDSTAGIRDSHPHHEYSSTHTFHKHFFIEGTQVESYKTFFIPGHTKMTQITIRKSAHRFCQSIEENFVLQYQELGLKVKGKQATQSNLFSPTLLQLQQLPQDEDTAIQLYKKRQRSPAENLLQV